MKRRSTALQAKFVADGIVDTLRRCGAAGVSFVCCLLTNQPADTADDVNVPLLRSQVSWWNYIFLNESRTYLIHVSQVSRGFQKLSSHMHKDTHTRQVKDHANDCTITGTEHARLIMGGVMT